MKKIFHCSKNFLHGLLLNLSLFIFLFLQNGTGIMAQTHYLVDDKVDIYPFIHDDLGILENDVFLPGDTIKRVSVFIDCIVISHADSLGNWTCIARLDHWGENFTDTGTYKVYLNNDTLIGNIIYSIHDDGFDYLDINNVKARFDCKSMHFFYDSSEFFVPKETGKSSIFSNSLWIGGKDENGDLHIAGGSGIGYNIKDFSYFDFYPGPILKNGDYNPIYDNKWNYIWNIRQSEIEFHKQHWMDQGYVPPYDILTWPGNGDITLGHPWRLAPFNDLNGDGLYMPQLGDYPEVRGDQALYFIFNDDRKHNGGGDSLKLEIYGMAYAFDMPDDSAMNNSVFLHYKIINRSDHTYDSTFIGIFTDVDLGYSHDDYLGFDVERNMYYGYNGDSVDGTGQFCAYGSNPPAQGIVLLSGPLMDPDGIDNPQFDNSGNQLCNYSVNGRKFGDQEIDNERYGVTSYLGVWDFPWFIVTSDWFLLSGRINDTLRFQYGDGLPGSDHLDCRFMFPGMSDTVNWGTDCVEPSPKDWTMGTSNYPKDVKGLQSCGPFTFHPGDVQEIDIAFIWARDYVNGTEGSIELLRNYCDQIRSAFEKNELSNGQPFYGVDEKHSEIACKIYPNPATGAVTIEMMGGVKAVSAELISSGGFTLRIWKLNDPKTTLDLSGIPAGLYLMKIETKAGMVTEKLVIR